MTEIALTPAELVVFLREYAGDNEAQGLFDEADKLWQAADEIEANVIVPELEYKESRNNLVWKRVIMERRTLADAGAEVGLSRERVRQIICRRSRELGFPQTYGRGRLEAIRTLAIAQE